MKGLEWIELFTASYLFLTFLQKTSFNIVFFGQTTIRSGRTFFAKLDLERRE